MHVMPPLVLLVVECSKGKDVQEKQGCAHRDGDTQFCGVVTLVHLERLAVLALCGKRRGVRPLGVDWDLLWCSWSDLRRWDLGGCGDNLRDLVQTMQVGNQFQPQVDLIGTVVFLDTGFEADVEVELIFLVVPCPGHLLKAVGFGMDELGVLWNRLIGVSGK